MLNNSFFYKEKNHIVIKIFGIKIKFKYKFEQEQEHEQEEAAIIRDKTIKILIAYHKKATLFRNDFTEPIHLGRALIKEASKDGVMSQEDYDWMRDNMMGDDTGENISHLNRYFNEMTALYWAWKNYDKLKNPDYFGFMHYRSIFLFSRYPYYEDNYLNCCGYQEVKKIIKSNDNIIICADWWNPEVTLYEYYLNCSKSNAGGFNFNIKFFDTLFIVLKEIDNNLYCEFKVWIDSKQGGPFKNMFIMPKDIFFDYCNFIFPIILKLYDKFSQYKYKNIPEMRNIAYLSEFLTAFYINKIKNNEQTYIVNVPIIRPL